MEGENLCVSQTHQNPRLKVVLFSTFRHRTHDIDFAPKSLNGIKSDGWKTCLKQKYLKKTQAISNQFAGGQNDDDSIFCQNLNLPLENCVSTAADSWDTLPKSTSANGQKPQLKDRGIVLWNIFGFPDILCASKRISR